MSLKTNEIHGLIIPFNGTVARDGFFAQCILFGIERKDLKFFFILCQYFTELGKDLTHLAHKEEYAE
jgi:hypothetical protein